jgi:myo-inositol-1(or 4)-monophosphatase
MAKRPRTAAPVAPDPVALRLLAEQAARIGGAIAHDHFGRRPAVRLKADRSEVTVADEAAQRAVIAFLHEARPADAYIGEETLVAPPARGGRGKRAALPPPANDRVCWVIDPIDGTRNFVRGVPLYVCCVAAMFGGKPIAGAIYHAAQDELYSASAAEGLFINGVASSAGARAARRRAIGRRDPVVGIPSMRKKRFYDLVHTWIDRFVVRNFGSTALHLAWVASGQLDGSLIIDCKLWDIAAGWIIVTRSGGRMTSPTGAPLFPIDVAGYQSAEMPTLAASRAAYGKLRMRSSE